MAQSSIFNSLKNEYLDFTRAHGSVPEDIHPKSIQKHFSSKLVLNLEPELSDTFLHKLKLYHVDYPEAQLSSLARTTSEVVQYAISKLPLWAASPTVRLAFGAWPFCR